MNEYTTQILLAIISAIGGGGVATLVQLLLNRRKFKAEAVRVSADTLGVDVKNRAAIEDFYGSLLNKREDMTEKIYSQLLDLEQRLAEQQSEASVLRSRNEQLTRALLEGGLDVPQHYDNGTSDKQTP